MPVLYYITPQVWAWGAGPARDARAHGDEGGGDPAVRGDAAARRTASTRRSSAIRCSIARRRCPIARRRARRSASTPNDRVLALFPGSRAQEIARHLDRSSRRRASCSAAIPALQGRRQRGAARRRSIRRAVRFRWCTRRRSRVLRAADAALCKSGTTTLEAAVAGCPLVVAYRTSATQLRRRRSRLVKIPNIGLVNVVAGTRGRARVRAGRARAAARRRRARAAARSTTARGARAMIDGARRGARVARDSRAPRERVADDGAALASAERRDGRVTRRRASERGSRWIVRVGVVARSACSRARGAFA